MRERAPGGKLPQRPDDVPAGFQADGIFGVCPVCREDIGPSEFGKLVVVVGRQYSHVDPEGVFVPGAAGIPGLDLFHVECWRSMMARFRAEHPE